MADKDFVVKNGLRTVGNTIVANSSQISLNSNVVVDNSASFTANGSSGSAGQLLASNGTGIYWTTPTTLTVNQAAQYSWTNTHSFSNTVTFNGNAAISTLSANGGFGSAGQVLISGGTSSNAYWAATPVNVAATYSWTNVHTFSNTLTITGSGGRLFLDGIPITANGSNGTSGQVLASNGSTGSPYWITPATGTVSQVNTGVGLTGGPVSTTGTISVNPNTGIVANSTGVFVSNTYVNTSSNFTVNGQLTFSNVTTFNSNAAFAAISANGSFGTAGHALFSGGGTTNNYFSNVVTSVSVTAGQIAATYSGANPTLGLATTAVTAGCYAAPTLYVDCYGRITAAANGSAGSGTVTQVDTGVGLVVAGGADANTICTSGTISLATAGPGAATYGATGGGVSCICVDAYGRIGSITTPTCGFATCGYVNGQGFVTSAVTSLSGGTGVSVSGSTGSVTVCIAQAVGTTSSVRFGSFGVGTTATGTTGEIVATGNITAYYSDKRLKKCINPIENALCKVTQISGVTYRSNEVAEKYGYKDDGEQVGVIAQEVDAVLPHAVKPAPFDTEWINGVSKSISGENYKTVQYEKIVPLLIEAIKELTARVEVLENKG